MAIAPEKKLMAVIVAAVAAYMETEEPDLSPESETTDDRVVRPKA